jgi:aspartate aminotransferase
MVDELSKITGFEVPTPQGAFYVYADVTGVLGKEYDGVRLETSLDLADFLLDKAEVAAVPGEAFGPSGYLRFSYALGDDALVEGVQRIQQLFGTK